ncbi:MAG: PH domain-containing protein [Egibacteraceae bacterium]
MPNRWHSAIPHEDRIEATRQHLLVLIPSAASAAVTGIVAFQLYLHGRLGLGMFLALLSVLFTLRFIQRAAEWWVDRIIVTTTQVLHVSGLFTRETVVLPLQHVTGLTYDRSIPGYMFHYGEFLLESAGHASAPMVITYMPNPDEFCSVLKRLLAERHAHRISGAQIP